MPKSHQEQDYIVEKKYDRLDSRLAPLPNAEYERCQFTACDFSDSDLSNIKFNECELTACNLSLCRLANTTFREVHFKDCKMLGLQFDQCSTFGLSFSFDNCILNHSSFYQLKLKKTIFRNCQLQEVDFTGADFTGSVFDNCDLRNAQFDRTILEKADFRTAHQYSIDPELNRLKKARFSASGIAGLLDKYDIEIDRLE